MNNIYFKRSDKTSFLWVVPKAFSGAYTFVHPVGLLLRVAGMVTEIEKR